MHLNLSYAILKPESPYFPVFPPDGHCPVLGAANGELEGSHETEFYVADLVRWTRQQIDAVAAIVGPARGGRKEDVLDWIAKGGELPLRKSQCVRVVEAFSLRAFL